METPGRLVRPSTQGADRFSDDQFGGLDDHDTRPPQPDAPVHIYHTDISPRGALPGGHLNDDQFSGIYDMPKYPLPETDAPLRIPRLHIYSGVAASPNFSPPATNLAHAEPVCEGQHCDPSYVESSTLDLPVCTPSSVPCYSLEEESETLINIRWCIFISRLHYAGQFDGDGLESPRLIMPLFAGKDGSKFYSWEHWRSIGTPYRLPSSRRMTLPNTQLASLSQY